MSQRFLHLLSLQDFVLFYDVQFWLSVLVNIFSYNIIFPNIIQIGNILLVYQFYRTIILFNVFSIRIIDNLSFFSTDSTFALLLMLMDRVINILRRQKGVLQLKVVLVLVCFVLSSAIFKQFCMVTYFVSKSNVNNDQDTKQARGYIHIYMLNIQSKITSKVIYK